jgi:SAM-dependent methyltransferase
MPFENKSVGGIFGVNTFHHIGDAAQFLSEVSRVLAKNGKLIMIEPANSSWGRFIYKNFHHEPFDMKGSWTIPDARPLSGGNQALPWIVFERDQAVFRERFPNLKIEKITYRNPLLYLLSGGVSYKQLLPDFMFPVINFLDRVLPGISKQVSMFEMIRIISI